MRVLTVALLAILVAHASFTQSDGCGGEIQQIETGLPPGAQVVAAPDPAPTLELLVFPDAEGGLLVQVLMENLEFAPGKAGTAYALGEGHAHLYVDGNRVTCLYDEAYFLGDLPLGVHEISVHLSANDHKEFVVGGAVVEDSQQVTVTSASQGDVDLGQTEAVDPIPTVDVSLRQDPMGGWILHATISDFSFAPEHVGTHDVSGEGYGRIYVDGTFVNRLYGEWYALGELAPEARFVSVLLSTNDHHALMHEGSNVGDTALIGEPETTVTSVPSTTLMVPTTVPD